MKPKKKNTKLVVALVLFIYLFVLGYLEIASAEMMQHYDMSFFEALTRVSIRLKTLGLKAFSPFNKTDFVMAAGIFSLAYIIIVAYFWAQSNIHKNENPGNEQGSAGWNERISDYNKQYNYPYGSGNKSYENNVILSNDVFLGLDGRKTQRNINTLVIGGSGAGKSRFYVKPNILQAGYADTSFVVTDPSGELLESCGKFLKDQGYKVQVFNLTDMEHSYCYNPFDYIREPEDVLILINCIIKNTTPEGAGAGDPFWEKSETALLQAIFFYLWQHRPQSERNFSSVMHLLRAANIDENKSAAKSPLDIIFDKIGATDPDDLGYKSYQTFRMAAGRTLKSILISAAVRLNAFEIPAVAKMVRHDVECEERNIDLTKVGMEKTAIFCVIPSADDTYNFIVAMLYYQLFANLYYSYDHDKVELKYPVRFMLDEFANIGQIPDFDKKLATMRKYKISCAIILQNLKQLEEMYDKKAEPLIGNCDEILFLGSSEESTLEYISKKLGKTTIKVRNTSVSKGKGGSMSQSYNSTQRDLMTPDEVGLMNTKDCILFIRGEKPFYGPKYKYEKHPNYKYTSDANKANRYDIETEFEALFANNKAGYGSGESTQVLDKHEEKENEKEQEIENREEKERIARELLEKQQKEEEAIQRQEDERRAKESQEKQEKERQEKERQEKERQEKERQEKEKQEKERQEKERQEKQKTEKSEPRVVAQMIDSDYIDESAKPEKPETNDSNNKQAEKEGDEWDFIMDDEK